MLLHRRLGGENDPGRPIGDLRAVAGGHLAPGPLEGRLELGERFNRGVGPHTVVEIIDPPVAGKRRLELARKVAVLLGARQLELTFDRILVGITARNIEDMRHHFRGLPHIELDHRIGQAALKPDDRLEHGGLEAREDFDPVQWVTRAGERREPFDRAAAIHQRGMAERIGAAGEHQISDALLDVTIGGVDRLHAGAAIDLHRERRHGFTHAEP